MAHSENLTGVKAFFFRTQISFSVLDFNANGTGLGF